MSNSGSVVPFHRTQTEIIDELAGLLEKAQKGEIRCFAYVAKPTKKGAWWMNDMGDDVAGMIGTLFQLAQTIALVDVEIELPENNEDGAG